MAKPWEEAPKRVRIWVGSKLLEGQLNHSPTALALWKRLPVSGEGNRWGEELYFYLPWELPQGDSQEVVEPGTLAYWPQGPALCIFWGPTPVSRHGECRAYSPVCPVGRILSDLSVLSTLEDAGIRMEAVGMG
jgi:hypothetical protein